MIPWTHLVGTLGNQILKALGKSIPLLARFAQILVAVACYSALMLSCAAFRFWFLLILIVYFVVFQFKVFRDGSWTRIDVKRDEPRLNRKEESGLFLASPWIKRYRPHRHHNGTSQNQSQLPLHQDSIDSIAGS